MSVKTSTGAHSQAVSGRFGFYAIFCYVYFYNCLWNPQTPTRGGGNFARRGLTAPPPQTLPWNTIFLTCSLIWFSALPSSWLGVTLTMSPLTGFFFSDNILLTILLASLVFTFLRPLLNLKSSESRTIWQSDIKLFLNYQNLNHEFKFKNKKYK